MSYCDSNLLKGIMLIPVTVDLTSMQAADILNVSCLFLIKLLNYGLNPPAALSHPPLCAGRGDDLAS
jgi:hypothetical protein